MPVVAELEFETRVVRGLDLEDIGEEIRAKVYLKSLNDTSSLGLATRKHKHCELFIGVQFHKLGSEHDSRNLLLVVVNLHCRVVGTVEGDLLFLVALVLV